MPRHSRTARVPLGVTHFPNSAVARRSFPAVALALALAGMAACKDPARDEALRVAKDQDELKSVVEADLRAERALRDVGEAERAQKDDEAARLLEADVLPRAESALAAARAVTPRTAWGKTRLDELLAAMTERRDELPRYVAALRAHDVEAELASVTKQIDIEKRALQAAQAIEDGPQKKAE